MKKAVLFSLVLLLTACSGQETAVTPSASETTTPAADQQQVKPLVVSTVAPLTNIVSNVAGQCAEVKGIIPEGTDSHTFEPRPSDADLLRQADLIIINGLSLEEPTKKLAESAKPKDTQIVELGNQTINQDQYLYDFSFPKSGGKPNPHLWVNTKYAEAYAKETAAALTKLRPQCAKQLQANLQNYLQRLEQLDKVTQEVVQSIPAKNRKLLTYHDSWAYWAKQYGFNVIGAIQPSSFSEPSAQDVAKLIDQVKQTGVPAIFGSEVYPSKVEEQISREANVKTANTADDDLPGEGSADAMESMNPQHTYIGMMADNLRILARNLGGNPNLVDQINPANVVGPTADKQAKQ